MSDRALLLREIREGRTYLESLPETVNIEFTGQCHVNPPCTYCVGKNAPGYVAPGHIGDELLDQYWPYLLQARRVNDCTYGEFQLYPGHETVVQRLSDAGVQFGFTTTEQLLTEKRSRFLIAHADQLEFAVSLNAATEATYFQYRGKGYDVAIRNLRRFAALHGRQGEQGHVGLDGAVAKPGRRKDDCCLYHTIKSVPLSPNGATHLALKRVPVITEVRAIKQNLRIVLFFIKWQFCPVF